jgi:branched-subunit amino acid ABC-type transport system permease component
MAVLILKAAMILNLVIWGTVFGSYAPGLINLSIGLDFGGYSLPAGYKDAFAFAIILLMLLFRPQGIFNTRTRAS